MLISVVKLREGRIEDLEKLVEAVNSALREADGNIDGSESEDDSTVREEWDGIVEVPEVDHEEDYIDEDRHTTVTIEAVDVSKDGLHKVAIEKEDDDESDEIKEDGKSSGNAGREGQKARNGKRVWTKERPGGPKKKKKKFRYESKAERKVTRHKERSGSRAKAKARRE